MSIHTISEKVKFEKQGSIGIVIMCKDEQKSILVTLKSVLTIADCFIIYDTGSSDNTIKLIVDFCKENNKNLHLITGEFVDFSVSRNVLLKYAEIVQVQFLLLLDVNDEFKGCEEFKSIIDKEKTTKNNGYRLRQNWVYTVGSGDEYYNTRLIKNNCGWMYFNPVHEYISSPIGVTQQISNPNIVIYQDRRTDSASSAKRFHRDKILLLAEYKKNPKDSRNCYYLGQTCMCLNHYDDAFYYLKRRSELNDFMEEKFHALLKLGKVASHLGHSWPDCMKWFMEAFEVIPRAEPMVRIAYYYMNKGKWILAYTFIKLACDLDFPSNCLLFVDKNCYEYERWHLLGRIAFYANKKQEGKIGCQMALKARSDSLIDKENLKFY